MCELDLLYPWSFWYYTGEKNIYLFKIDYGDANVCCYDHKEIV